MAAPPPEQPGTEQRYGIVKTSAFEQHAQTLITTVVGGLLLFSAGILSSMSREVAGLGVRIEALTAVQTSEAGRRDAAIGELARTVAVHERQLADLNARQAADDRRAEAEHNVRRRP